MKTLKLLSAIAIVTGTAFSVIAQTHTGNVTIDGKLGAGTSTVNGQAFGFSTVLLREDNLRITFLDESTTAGFPTNDWEIEINASTNGGDEYFAIDDIDGGKTPFKIEAGARTNALFVESTGDIGIGTDNPVIDIHAKTGDTPGLRLEQDGTSGWTPQTWDLSGNETNFFIRDVTNGSKLPLRIRPNSPTSSIELDASVITLNDNGDVLNTRIEGDTDENLIFADATNDRVGIGTESPVEKLQVEGAIKLGTTSSTNDGTIRFTGSDFEGYIGGTWKSLFGTDDQNMSLAANLLSIEDGNSVDLSPILTDLYNRVSAIEVVVNGCCGSNLLVAENTLDEAKLFQNYPNPFDESTIIEFYLPDGYSQAFLEIYSSDGKLVSKMNVGPVGKGQVVIGKGTLAVGNYFYTLMADDQLIGTKQMTISH